MINQEEGAQKKIKAIRKAISEVKEDCWNPRRIICWMTWTMFFIAFPLVEMNLFETSFFNALLINMLGACIISILITIIYYIIEKKYTN